MPRPLSCGALILGACLLLAGTAQVTMIFVGPLALEQHVAAGKLRALATADKKRSAVLA